MRTAEEIIREHLGGNMNISTLTVFALSEIINEARKEAIIECAERAKVEFVCYGMHEGGDYILDKQSILSLIDELK